MEKTFLSHNNSNLMCAVEVMCCGDNPLEDDIFQISVLPLNTYFEPLKIMNDKKITAFNIYMRPNNPHSRITGFSMDNNFLRTSGIDPINGSEMFDKWVEKLNLRTGKKIMPISYNWPKKSAFLMEWLGGPINFYQHFDWHYRDLLSVSMYQNDQNDLRGERYVHPKQQFNYILSTLNNKPRIVDGLEYAHCIAEGYKKLIT